MKFNLLSVAVVSLLLFCSCGKQEEPKTYVNTYEGKIEDYSKDKILICAVWAEWASVWMLSEDVLSELKKTHSTQFDFMYVNANQNKEFVKKNQIDTIPTVLLVKNGKVFSKLPNMVKKQDLIDSAKKIRNNHY